MKYIIIVLVLSSLLLGYKIYEQKNPNIKFDNSMLKIIKQSGEVIKLKVKIADSPAERARGLMFVKQMPEDEAMLFVFDTEEMRRMWMKNTLIPLDMLFVGSNKEILNFKENAEPESLEIIFSVAPSKYVIELNGGFISKHNIKIGDKIEYNQ
jgi:uncharacterized membrane protein (UPF0127 family)